MQDNLTLLFDLILAAGGGYLSLGFTLGLVGLWRRCDPSQQPVVVKAERAKAVSDRKADAVAAETSAIEAAVETKVPLEPIPLGEMKRPEAEPEPLPELARDEVTEPVTDTP